MNKRIVVNLLKYLLAFGLLGWVIYQNWGTPGSNGLSDIWQKHVVQGQPIRADFLLLGFVIYTASVLITLMRWYLLVRAQDLPFTPGRALRLGLIGVFFNTFLPGSVGGDIIRAASLAKEQSRRTIAVATVIMDRVIALCGLIWFVTLLGGVFWAAGMLDSGPGADKSRLIVQVVAAIAATTLVVWIALGFLPSQRAEIFAGRLARIPKVGTSVAELWRAVWMYRSRPGSIALVMGLSWVGHVGFVLSYYCFARTLWTGAADSPIPTLTQHFLLVPIGLVAQAMPLFPGGVGVGEAVFGELYRILTGETAARANGVLGSLVRRIVEWTIGLVGLVLWLRVRSRLPASATPAPPPESAVAPQPSTNVMTGDGRWNVQPTTSTTR